MLTLHFKIEDPEMESILAQIVQSQKRVMEDIAKDALAQFVRAYKGKQIVYVKKEIAKHIHLIPAPQNDGIDNGDSDGESGVPPYSHVDDVASYMRDQRMKKRSE